MLVDGGWMTGANPQQRRHSEDFFSYPLTPILLMLQTSSLTYGTVVHALSYIDPLHDREILNKLIHTYAVLIPLLYIHHRILYVRVRGMHTVKFASNK